MPPSPVEAIRKEFADSILLNTSTNQIPYTLLVGVPYRLLPEEDPTDQCQHDDEDHQADDQIDKVESSRIVDTVRAHVGRIVVERGMERRVVVPGRRCPVVAGCPPTVRSVSTVGAIATAVGACIPGRAEPATTPERSTTAGTPKTTAASKRTAARSAGATASEGATAAKATAGAAATETAGTATKTAATRTTEASPTEAAAPGSTEGAAATTETAASLSVCPLDLEGTGKRQYQR